MKKLSLKREVFVFVMVAMDTVLITASYITAFWLRERTALFGIEPVMLDPLNYRLVYPVLLFSWLTILTIMRQYEPRRRWEMQDILFSTSVAVTIGTLFLLVFSYIIFHLHFSRLVLVYLWVAGIALLSLWRLVVRSALRWCYKKDIALRTVVIGGFGEAAKNLARDYKKYPEMLFKLKGFVIRDDYELSAEEEREAKSLSEKGILGKMSALEEIVYEEGASYVILTGQLPDKKRLTKIFDELSRGDMDVKVVPSLYELGPKFLDFDEVGTVPIIGLREIPMMGWEAVGKRVIDIIGSLIGLVLLFPLFLVIAVLIKREDKGPVLFTQERIGQFGKTFKMHKFRTMKINSDNGSPRTEVNDSRITKVGSFLRKTSIDELPQLLNVLKGDMSLVGPRPDSYEFFKEYSQWHKNRLYLRPGLTGLAQCHGVRGGGHTLSEDKTQFDIEYMQNQSLWLDIKILFKTLITVLFHKEAY